MQPAFSALAGLWRGAVGEVVVGHAVEQAVEEVGWVGLVGRAKELERHGAVFKENILR